ncbi:ABC transporter ATP-binding protein [Acetonema longum]|nr:ABC transporter ATP-binding protein [Acetonema longum]
MTNIAVKIENISKVYKLYNRPIDRLKESLNPFSLKYHQDFFALNNVSFDIQKGESVGIIGKNGSGKSTLLKIITGVLTPTSGTVTVKGRIAALLELGAGFNPEYTGIENIYLQGSIMGVDRLEMEEKIPEILDFADIGEFIHQPVKNYSSGMFVRLAFAVSTIVEPDILIVDEALAVGDVFFRQKCFDRMEYLRRNDTSIIMVTHSMNEIRQYCNRALLLNQGRTLFWGSADEAVQHYFFLDNTMDNFKNGLKVDEKGNNGRLENNSWSRTKIDWPSNPNAFYALPRESEVINNGAICTSVALCNSNREPSRMFVQGETGIFYYEFELSQDADVPIGGILLFNDKNILIHGKNSLQYDIEAPERIRKGAKVRFKQEITLAIAPGEYTFSLGFSTIAKDVFLRRNELHYIMLDENRTNLCYVGKVGSFFISACLGNSITEIPFHGLADLPGDIVIDAK